MHRPCDFHLADHLPYDFVRICRFLPRYSPVLFGGHRRKDQSIGFDLQCVSSTNISVQTAHRIYFPLAIITCITPTFAVVLCWIIWWLRNEFTQVVKIQLCKAVTDCNYKSPCVLFVTLNALSMILAVYRHSTSSTSHIDCTDSVGHHPLTSRVVTELLLVSTDHAWPD